jgi:CBS-domain-containing membrane protein
MAFEVIANVRDTKTSKVADVMSQGVITCNMDDDIQKAVDAMADNQLRRIPVVDANQKIVGIIAQADVATRMDEPQETAKMVKEISQPA